MDNLVTHILAYYSYKMRHWAIKLMAGNVVVDILIKSEKPTAEALKARFVNVQHVEILD